MLIQLAGLRQLHHMAALDVQTLTTNALFSWLDPRQKALSGDALTSGLLLFRHVGDGCDQRFEQRLQLRLLTEALHQFDPRSHRSFAGVFEGVEGAARHAHALRHVGLDDFFLHP